MQRSVSFLNLAASICQHFLSVTYSKNKMHASRLAGVTLHTPSCSHTSHDYKGLLDCAKCSVTHFSTILGDGMPDRFSGLETRHHSE